MKRKLLMNLNIFDDGGNGGDGSQGNNAGTGGSGQKGNAGYTFEQAEEIANSRADRASRVALADFFRKQGLSEAEITTAISDFKAKQAANKPNVSVIEKERDDAKKELQQVKNTIFLRDKGVKAEDLDYVLFKVEQLVDDKTDFSKAADKFLKENPRFTGAGTYRVSTSTSTGDNGNSGNMNSSINDRIRAAARR